MLTDLHYLLFLSILKGLCGFRFRRKLCTRAVAMTSAPKNWYRRSKFHWFRWQKNVEWCEFTFQMHQFYIFSGGRAGGRDDRQAARAAEFLTQPTKFNFISIYFLCCFRQFSNQLALVWKIVSMWVCSNKSWICVRYCMLIRTWLCVLQYWRFGHMNITTLQNLCVQNCPTKCSRVYDFYE